LAIDLDAPLRFLRTAFRPDDWIAVLLKSHETGGTAQRDGPLSPITYPRFQAWLRAQSARRFSVFVSVNAIRPQAEARTRDAIGEIRHVLLDADEMARTCWRQSACDETYHHRRTSCTPRPIAYTSSGE
jgi:hypothetical protein